MDKQITVFLKGWRAEPQTFPADFYYLKSSSGGTLLVVRKSTNNIVAAFAAGEWRAAVDNGS